MREPDSVDWTEIDWEDLYPRLLLFTASKLKRLTWRGKLGGHVPGMPTEYDFVQAAVLKTMEGTRRWSQKISLFQHLAGVISSDINHLAMSEDNKTTAHADDTIVQIEDYRPTPEAVVLRKKDEEHFFAYLEAKRPALKQLAHLILHESVRTTDELMARLSLSLRDIESLKKALRRATDAYLETRDDTGGHLKDAANDC
jgi:hypothetical protein